MNNVITNKKECVETLYAYKQTDEDREIKKKVFV